MVLVRQKMAFGLSFVTFLYLWSYVCFLKFVQRFLYTYFSAFVLEFKLLLLDKMRQNWFTLSLFILQLLVFFLKCTLCFQYTLLCSLHFLWEFLLCKAVNSYWLYRAPVLCNKLPHLGSPIVFMKWEHSAFLKINIYFANERLSFGAGWKVLHQFCSLPQTKVLPYRRVHQACYTRVLNGLFSSPL